MNPIRTKYTNKVLGKPKDWDENAHGPCVGLPVCVTDDPYVYSWWKASWRERISLLFGRPIRLCVVGTSQPPVALDVDGAD